MALMQDENDLTELLNGILDEAMVKQATDIHIEPCADDYRIRLRIDGLLYESHRTPINIAKRLSSHIKIMANLDIAEKRLPQDGRWQLNQCDARISTCPTLHGEKLVIRLFPNEKQALNIEEIGLNNKQQLQLIQAIKQPQGLILVTGPTGSGKTTTLYSLIQSLNQSHKNICTVEDPVEINLKHINQVTINHKIQLNFSLVLRAFLRQDPDIIMVGEIRDLETAKIAIHAAQTGHLVLSTLHTNNSAEAIARLMSMGIAGYDLITGIILISNQRLVRRLCDHCKQKERLSEEITRQYFPSNPLVYRSVGCEQCQMGFSGRFAIHELRPLNRKKINPFNSQQSIEKISNESIDDLLTLAKQAVLKGVTSWDEIQRVIPTIHQDPINNR